MRTIYIIGNGCGVLAAMIALSGCGAKKEITEHKLVAVQSKDVSVATNYQSKLTVDYFGDVLTGDWNLPDSGAEDSTTVESNGVKIKLTAKNGKLHYAAQAKPVARSTLESKGQSKTEDHQKSSLQVEDKKTKTVNRMGLKAWLIIAALSAIVILLSYTSIKNILLKWFPNLLKK